MKYFALFSLFCSLNTFTCDYPKENKQNAITHVRINNTSNAPITCWFFHCNNPSVAYLQQLSIKPKDETNIKTMPGTNIALYHLSKNTNVCIADLTITPEYKDILITPTFAVQKRLRNGLWQ